MAQVEKENRKRRRDETKEENKSEKNPSRIKTLFQKVHIGLEQDAYTIQLSIDFIYEHWRNHISPPRLSLSSTHTVPKRQIYPHFWIRKAANVKWFLWIIRCSTLLCAVQLSLNISWHSSAIRHIYNSQTLLIILRCICILCEFEYIYIDVLEMFALFSPYENWAAHSNFRLKFTISEFITCNNFLSSFFLLLLASSALKHMHNLSSWKSKLLQFT